MTQTFRLPALHRRAVCAGLATALVGGPRLLSQPVAAQSATLDTDVEGYPLGAAAKDHLHWWTTPSGVTRAYDGAAGSQLHLRLTQPQRPRSRPVILLHNTGQSGRVWDHVLPLLGADRAVIAPDLPAHGDSDGDPLTSTSNHAAVIGRLADRLGLSQFDLIGDGLGAHVALTVAAMTPARVGRVILSGADVQALAAPARPDPADMERADFLLQRWQQFTGDYLSLIHI